MKKTLERLRALKAAAVERMSALNELAKKDNRELNETEKMEFQAKKEQAEGLEPSIKHLEEELAASPAPVTAPAPVQDVEALTRKAIENERVRASGIRAAASRFKLDSTWVEGLVAKNLSVEASNAEILTKGAEAFEKNQTNGHVGEITRDATDTRRECMQAGLLLRSDPRLSPELAEKGRLYANMSLLRIAEECLQAAGVKTRGMSSDTIARLALQGRAGAFTAAENFGLEYFEGGMGGMSDFPAIVANVANKRLRQAYEAAPASFKEFSVPVTAQDFKPLNSVQLSDLGALQQINENGEFHRTALSDNKETYSLATFGEVVALTRKVIINDDLQAFTRVPALLGMAAARLESDTVWAIITANGAMADGVALFHATHKNLSATNGLAAVANITTARTQLRKQTGPKGTILNLVPKYLLVPAALEGIAFQLTNPINLAATASSADVPAFIRTMVPIVEPRLDAVASVGATNWFTVADPSMISTIEYAYLAGQEGVFIETRQGFDVDGVEIKARMDFGAAAVEFRGLQKNTA